MAALGQKLSLQVKERDDYRCAGCGVDIRSVRWYSIQHRRARGVGGDETDLANLVTLCGSATTGCHWLCEQRDEEMNARGLWLRNHQEPAKTPVVLWTGEAVLLTSQGTRMSATTTGVDTVF